jgi:hypothetical protein
VDMGGSPLANSLEELVRTYPDGGRAVRAGHYSGT